MPTNRTKENEIAIPAASAPVRRKSSTPHTKHALKTPPVSAPEADNVDEVAASQATYTPTDSEIAALAYTYWAGRGCQGGSPEEDWLRAEKELRAKASA